MSKREADNIGKIWVEIIISICGLVMALFATTSPVFQIFLSMIYQNKVIPLQVEKVAW